MSNYQTVEFPITVTLSAYTANDVVGGVLTSDHIKQIDGRSYVQWGRLIDGANQAEEFYLYLFSATPTSAIANDAAFVPTEADWALCLGSIHIQTADYDTYGTEADCAFFAGKDRKTGEFVTLGNLDNGRLYAYLVAVSTPDYANAADLTLHLNIMTE